MIDGIMEHSDSNGGGGSITNGDTQWMTAGSGILHIEKPPEHLVISGGLFHGFQLWVNLPRSQKLAAPRYQDLRASEERLRTIYRHVPMGIIQVDPAKGALQMVNPAFCDMTGYGPQELLMKSPSILQGPKTDAKVLERLESDISAGRVFHGRAVNYRKDGSEFMMEWKIAPIRNALGHISHYLAIQKDVSHEM